MKHAHFVLVVATALFFASGISLARAEFYVISVPAGVGTPITSAPYTISSPGFYYFRKDLTSSGTGITVNTDNVTIDLMGFSLTGSGTGYFMGIDITGGRNNVEIRNGTVRNFSGHGINDINAGLRQRIINMRVQDNGAYGIHISGNSHLVQNCNVSGNGGTGINLIGKSNVIGNVCIDNGGSGISHTGGSGLLKDNLVADNDGYGFNVSYLGTSYTYVFDGNSVSANGLGSINGIPPGAAWGVNGGIP